MLGLLFTYGMTYIGSVVSLFRPYYGFLVYVAFANLKPESLWPWSVPQGNYSRTIAICFFAGWAMSGMGQWDFKTAKSTVYSLIFFWFWLLLGVFISPEQVKSWELFDILTKVYVPLIAGLTLIDSVEKLKQLVWVLVLSNGFVALQFNDRYFKYGINDQDWKFAGLDNNGIAITMVVGFGLAFFVALCAERWWQSCLAFGCAGLMAHVVLFSMSRGGMLAMCMVGFVTFLLIPKKPVHYLLFMAAIAVVLRLAGESVQNEFLSLFNKNEDLDASAQSRFALTRDALDCMFKNPIFGCGLMNWGNVAPDYGWPLGKRAHNTWAEFGATLGIPGFVGILWVYFSCYWNLFKLVRSQTPKSDPSIQAFASAVLAGTAGFLLGASFVTCDQLECPYYLVVLGAGVLKVYGESLTRVPQPARLAQEKVTVEAFYPHVTSPVQ